MRLVGLSAICLLVAACTIPPIFPPEIMKDVEKDPVAIKTWKEQTSSLSGNHFVSHKVALGGQIVKVIPKPDGVIILARERPMDKYLGYGPTSIIREGAFEFAIVFNGFLDDTDMLQPGNQLGVVGTTESSSQEVIDGMPKALPHIVAQCLNIWKTDGFEPDFAPYESAGYYPLEKRTFCREKGKGGA